MHATIRNRPVCQQHERLPVLPADIQCTGLGAVNSGLCEGVPIDESRARLLTIIACVFGPLAIFAILLRTYSRLTITKMMGNDDWTMLVAGMFLIGVLICNFESRLSRDLPSEDDVFRAFQLMFR